MVAGTSVFTNRTERNSPTPSVVAAAPSSSRSFYLFQEPIRWLSILSGAVTGQATVNLYEVIDVTGTITANGPSVLVPLPTPGQNGRLTFEGTAGQRISANATGATFNGCWNLGIYKPDGTQLANTFSCGG